jgi:HlyD family secretion protein
MSLQVFAKPGNRWLMGLMMAATAVTGAMVFYGISRFGQMNETPLPAQTAPPIWKITALGRLQPEAEVIRLSAPVMLNNDRVAKLLVQRGDRVKAGQVIAILDSRDRLQKALLEAQKQVSVAQSKLAQVKAGAKSGEIAAQQAQITRLQAELQGEITTQQATIARWQSEVKNASAEYNRNLLLYKEGAISASSLDQKRLALETNLAQLNEAKSNRSRTAETLRAQIKEAKATLNRIVQVRPVDVQAAQTEVDAAIATVKRAEAELNQTYIRAPMAGRILEIYAKPGEAIGDKGIVDLGQTDRMEVVAEVYQTDIGKVRAGQAAVITSESFSGELHGIVRLIGLLVSQQKVFSNQPGENLDRRVVEVRIRLTPEDSKHVEGLTNLQVQVAIQQ